MGILDAPGVSRQKVAAQRILAAAQRPDFATQLDPAPPTCTLSAASAATSISGGVRIAPRRASTTAIDTATDPHFEYLGQRAGLLDVSSTDMSYPQYLTGGASQAQRDRVRFRFAYSGSQLDVYLRARGTTLEYRIWTDGTPHSASFVTAAMTANSRYMLNVNWGSAKPRIVEIEIATPEFGGVYIEPTASISRTRLGRPTLLGFGDSLTQGASGVSSGDSWLRWGSQLLGCDWINTAIGGTGYIASNSGVAAFFQRIAADVVPFAPDLLTVWGGFNDDSIATDAAIQTAAESLFSSLKTALPGTIIVVVGNWLTSGSASATGYAVDQVVKAAADNNGLPFISLMDPTQKIATTPAWAATTAYQPGDTVVANGWVQKCIVAHTSGASFVQTNWRPSTFITGTGRVGNLIGDGNADVIIGTDGTHPSATGHRILGYHLAQEITRVLRRLASV